MLSERLSDTLNRLRDAADAAKRPMPTLVAVSKFHPAQAVAELAAAGQRVFGENYVQEAQAKRAELSALALEWHLIGHLQSNKAALAAELFDWVQTVDRPKLVAALAAARSPQRGPLNVLIQVNIDDESSKHGCAPEAVEALAEAIAAQPRLALRGLMAIPAPHEDPALRRAAFVRMKQLFDALAARHAGVDTLSMGMSEDCALAVAEGATMVRVGTALFGARPVKA
ncbi:YggS family pyridoxal phosphate-dependent enzyme [Pseudoxanthomonas winnipegensis]|uniref:Pyridoxal phosphate homeostasis protein n=1 Tax=Pseudoxanthomonas winnipegensis TaxID=2480810 RepID=A0ABY1WDF9_9GAMM|nr:YggS family pyridoxal phosphate-dependent enzyme [Pseudoxanthomonas winnipegensis]TAA19393.1 YggS family pyridoxal phosphate-dependent enzyme [Pseudoxanthomonas winnipegensis]TAH70226.1 YggS family pyridoxal phosphate-dependent enzyme [Pseudoxanthomonas winnipegensis]